MPAYKAPVEDALFLLNDVFHIERFANLPGFAEASPDVLAAVFGNAARFCEEVLAPLNRAGDLEPARIDNGVVRTPAGFADAYKRFVEMGWNGIAADPSHGMRRMALSSCTRCPGFRDHATTPTTPPTISSTTSHRFVPTKSDTAMMMRVDSGSCLPKLA